MKKFAMLLSLIIVGAFLLQVASEMREFGEPYEGVGPDDTIIKQYDNPTGDNNYMDEYMLNNSQEDTGTNNVVTAVVFDFRGFDTLGEATVLFTAVSSIYLVFRRKMDLEKDQKGKGKKKLGSDTIKEMSTIVRTSSNIAFPFILIFGFYIILHGHLTPGGGFQGGAVAASAIALILVAHGWDKAKHFFSKDNFSIGESLGLFFFISLAFLGIAAGEGFFYNFLAHDGYIFGNSVIAGSTGADINTGGTVPLLNMAVGFEVICAFGIILFSMLKGMDYLKEREDPPNTDSSKGGEN